MLAALGQLWSFVDFFHPETERHSNWDKALAEAIPRIDDNTSDSEFAEVIEGMLRHLSDPSTQFKRMSRSDFDATNHVIALQLLDPSAEAVPAKNPSAEHLLNGLPELQWHGPVPVVRINDPSVFSTANESEILTRLNEIAASLLDEISVVIDLRCTVMPRDKPLMKSMLEASDLMHALTDVVLQPPEKIVRHYHGLKPSSGTSSGGYAKFRKSYPADLIYPLPRKSVSKETVFLINRYSVLPFSAVALQMKSKACILSEEDHSGDLVDLCARLRIPNVGDVLVRLSEFGGYETTKGGFRVNQILNDETHPLAGPRQLNMFENRTDRALEWAVEQVLKRGAFESPYTVQPISKSKKILAKQKFPSRENRLIAAYKIWLILTLFFPYKDLMEKHPDEILLEFIPLLDACANAREYALTISKMMAHTADTHVNVYSSEMESHHGTGAPPVVVRMIEDLPVVTCISPTLEETELQIGDVIESIDGKPVFDLLAAVKPVVAASTPQSEQLRKLALVLRGKEDSEMKLGIARGEKRFVIRVMRTGGNTRIFWTQRNSGDIVRLLQEGRIGYADLARLTKAQVQPMFEKFKRTKGIIFDMRGYPNGTAWSIAPRLLTSATAAAERKVRGVVYSNVKAALFKCSMNPDPEGNEFPLWHHFEQPIPWSDEWKYFGKTVLLIDETAISQAEHTGLFFKAANNTTFIGTATAGANGDVTIFSLPGSIRVSMSGQSVEYPDGTRLQRVGLIPDIEVKPTIYGIRNGVDEILNRAIEYITES